MFVKSNIETCQYVWDFVRPFQDHTLSRHNIPFINQSYKRCGWIIVVLIVHPVLFCQSYASKMNIYPPFLIYVYSHWLFELWNNIRKSLFVQCWLTTAKTTQRRHTLTFLIKRQVNNVNTVTFDQIFTFNHVLDNVTTHRLWKYLLILKLFDFTISYYRMTQILFRDCSWAFGC